MAEISGARTYQEAESLLRRTWEEVRHQHDTPAGRRYVSSHWSRYAHIVRALPALRPGAPVLEIGASIMASVLRRRFQADVHAAHHELETEWPARFREEGIRGEALELMRDPLPYPPRAFDLILFDEVMEHFPLAPGFFLRQVLRLLKPGGQLLFSVPNFATVEHRWALLRGRNPQDPMDERFVYYAHHREPVMQECLELVERCGGRVLESQWTDYRPPASVPREAWNCLRHLRHLEWHKLAHALVPSLRSYLFLRAARRPDADAELDTWTPAPPMSDTREFARRPMTRPIPSSPASATGRTPRDTPPAPSAPR